jgi:60 kDa SS-A/Ro ribonucleoprotein
VKVIDNLPFDATDCAQPMLWATKNNIEADAFVILTDNETWSGYIQPAQALQQYRQKFSIPAKLVVVGMTSTQFSIADPNDIGMMDVVGCDPATPELISNFIRGDF